MRALLCYARIRLHVRALRLAVSYSG